MAEHSIPACRAPSPLPKLSLSYLPQCGLVLTGLCPSNSCDRPDGCRTEWTSFLAMCPAVDLPEGLSLVFKSLLAEGPALLHQLLEENSLKAANRHALIGPVVRGLQLLHDYWAYKGMGTLRREPHEFMAQWDFQDSQRKAPIHEMTSLAAFLLLFVANKDEAPQQQDTVTGFVRDQDASSGLLVPPPKLTMAVAQTCAQHIRLAYNSLHTPFPSWNAQFSELNLHYIHILHAHSGYAQTRYIALTCLGAIDAATWSMDICAAAASVSRLWKCLFRKACRRNKVIRALAQLLLMKTRPSSPLVDKWAGLRRDLWRAAQIAGPPGISRWPQQDPNLFYRP